MEVEQQIYEQHGMEEYIKYQIEHECEPMAPGPAFSFVKALEAVNTRLRELYPESKELFDVVLMTNNAIDQRLINNVTHHRLNIKRFCMTGGSSPIGYLKAYHTNLYLSSDPVEVREALEEGIVAATMFSPGTLTEVCQTQLRVAFDAVLFKRIVKAHRKGPLKGFLEALGKLQKKFYAKDQLKDCPIRTYMLAIDSVSSGTWALNTLQSWGLEMDEVIFLAGAHRGPMLEKIRPHIFFDDQMFQMAGAAEMGTEVGHVPYGEAQTLPSNKSAQEKDSTPVSPK